MADLDDHVKAVEESLRRAGGYTPAQIQAAIKALPEDALTRIGWRTRWVSTRHQHQVPPGGEIERGTWLLMGGRGSGKTRVGAEEIAFAACVAGKGDRSLVSSSTSGDIRGTCIEGDSGLLNVIPGSLIKKHVRSLNEVHLNNGAYIGGIPASEPERFRGPQWHRAWLDEIAAWSDDGNDAEYAWKIMALSVRLGKRTWKVASTTPKPVPLIFNLVEQAKDPERHVTITTATTYDNIENLSDDFKSEILVLEGTQLGMQEIYAQVLNPESTGIIKRNWVKIWPHNKPLPDFELVIASLDTAYSDKHYDIKRKTDDEKRPRTDPSACSVWGCYREPVTLASGKVVLQPRIILLYCWQKWLNFPDLIREVKVLQRMRFGRTDKEPMIKPLIGPKVDDSVGRKIDLIVIEEKASGKSVRQQLAQDGIITRGYNPGKADKLTRLHLMSPIIKAGFFYVIESERYAGQGRFKTWAEPLVQQVCGFSGPKTIIHDDLLDTTTQALRFINDLWLKYLPPADPREAQQKKQQIEVENMRSRANPYG